MMLVVYAIQIDINITDYGKVLPADRSIGFTGIAYCLSTAPLTGFYDCLDGNSFSDISQQNMILHGGELSLAGDVKIKIVSKVILEHISRNDIELLGSKVSMSAMINGVQKSIFEGMLVSGYSQIDEVSLEINLEDSAFANAGQLYLKVPQGFGGGAHLETSYGARCLLKFYKQDKKGVEQDKTISQGIVRNYPVEASPELEQKFQTYETEVLTTFGGKIAFVKNFTISKVLNLNSGSPARILVGLNQEFSSKIVGSYIEVCSGKGKGNFYKIIRVEIETYSLNYVHYREVILDRPINDGDISCELDGSQQGLGKMPIAGKYQYLVRGDGEFLFDPPNIVDLTIMHNANNTEVLSVFRFTDAANKYAVPRMKNIGPHDSEGYHVFKVVNDDGALSEVNYAVRATQEKDYSILEFSGSLNGKTTMTKIGRHQPRWAEGASAIMPSGKGISFWANRSETAEFKINANTNQEVPIDSEDEDSYACVVDGAGFANGLQACLYWRIDDIPCNGKYKIKPQFSFWMRKNHKFSARALLLDDACNIIAVKNYNIDGIEDNDWHGGYTRISLTRENVQHVNTYGDVTTYDGSEISEDYMGIEARLMTKLKNLLVFEAEIKVKYIYLQMFFDSIGSLDGEGLLYFSALPVKYEQEVDTDKIYVEAYDQRHFGLPYENIADRTKLLCEDYNIGINEKSFEDSSKEINECFGSNEGKYPSIPLKHGDNFHDKLAEICRAANFSMFSDGSKLHARYFFSGKPEWTIGSANVIKGSLEVRFVDSVATDIYFSVNTQDGQKTLSVDISAEKFEEHEWSPAGEPFLAELIYRGYMQNAIPGFRQNAISGFGARVKFDNSSIRNALSVGSVYRITMVFENGQRYIDSAYEQLVSLRLDEEGADALFIKVEGFGAIAQNATKLEITPLKEEVDWKKIVCGNLDIDPASARYLWETLRNAFKKTKKRSKLDERYSKHQVIAFATDKAWLQNILATVKYNSFAKSIISFKVPIDSLPEGSLPSLLLRKITLAFGRFKNKPLEGWIVGYSFAPAEDAVRIEFINSEPMESTKQILWLDENLLKDQLTVNEMELSQKFYSEI
jgi:hypothetical protein